MKSLIVFLKYVLKDLGTWCQTSTDRDFKEATVRVEHSGLSFLTIDLANFGKDFERSLDQGFVGSDCFLGFRRASRGLPLFLEGFLCQVFDSRSGQLLKTPNITAIWAIRQFTLMWAKINVPCSDARTQAAIVDYLKCEKDVFEESEEFNLNIDFRRDDFERISFLLFGDVLSAVNEDIYYGRIVPKHGPGATADKLYGNVKWNQHEWTERLEEIFPHQEYLSPNVLLSLDKLDHVDILEPGAERPVKVITVPKTLKAPRIIAIEPTCMQYMQQGIKDSVEKHLFASDTANKLIGYSDQGPNRVLARKGSLDGTLATLDMSEASDRVSNQHVVALLSKTSFLREGVEACRSAKADVPGLGEIPLSKYASMGSALTFPMEAMVFCTVIFMGIEKALNCRITKKIIYDLLGRVRVYGDDIIVPVDFVSDVVEALESFNFRVNSSKSFWTGMFRESCGKDFYAGEDVSVVRLRSFFPTRRQHAPEIISTVSTRNQLYYAGLWGSCRFLDELLEKVIPFPVTLEESPLLGRQSFLGYSPGIRIDPQLQRPLVRGAVVATRPPKDILEDYGALLKCLTVTVGNTAVADDHLERAGRPQTVDIKLRWKQPY